jgi:hypothetical protein
MTHSIQADDGFAVNTSHDEYTLTPRGGRVTPAIAAIDAALRVLRLEAGRWFLAGSTDARFVLAVLYALSDALDAADRGDRRALASLARAADPGLEEHELGAEAGR